MTDPMNVRPENYNASDFAAEANVSRETFEAFEHWQGLLLKWNRKINLVSSAAISDFWRRHALDSWQVTSFLRPTDETILDLGSGAGFPGIAHAIYLKTEGRAGEVTLVESAGKKANFLRTVIRELGLPAKVWADRAENLPPKSYDVISARAFAPLPQLLTYAQPFWGDHTQALLLKGEAAGDELTDAAKSWTFNMESQPSLSDEGGKILTLTGLRAKA